MAFKSISNCWQYGIYLQQLFIRFFKLTLQIISRICSWTDEVSETKNWSKPNDIKRIDFLVTVYLDMMAFAHKIPNIVDIIVENNPVQFNTEIPTLTDSIKESEVTIQNHLSKLESQWQEEILVETSGWTKQVADIPRLYRKTNRDAPTKACNYVDHILKPAQTFHRQYSSALHANVIQNCLRNVFSQFTNQ